MAKFVNAVATLETLAGKDKQPLLRGARISEAAYEAAKKIKWFTEAVPGKPVVTADFEAVMEADRRLSEAHSSTATGQLLRAGLQTIANRWYELTDKTYPAYSVAVSSDKAIEFYTPKLGSSLPRPAGKLTPALNINVKFGNVSVVNEKYMGLLEIESELEEDDQSGQIGMLAGDMGENAGILEEAMAAGRLLHQSFTIGDDTYTADAYSKTNASGTAITKVFSDNFYATSVGNSLGTGGSGATGGVDLSTIALAKLRSKLLRAVNPLNVKIMARPDVLVYGTGYDNKVRTLLNSLWNPSIPGLSGETMTTATSGSIPGIGAYNPFSSLYKPAMNTYLPEWAWLLMNSRKGFIVQRRVPWTVMQENPASGLSFQYDMMRWRNRSRFAFAYLDGAFSGLGNDGTTTGSY